MIRINLLSDREAIRKETSRQQVSVFLLGICLLVVLLGGLQFTLYQRKNGLEEKIRSADMALKELQAKVGEVEKYKALKKELEDKLRLIEVLKAGKMWAPHLLDSLGETIPEKMWLSKLSLVGTSLAMEGYSVDNETIAKFMKDLEQSRFFRNVELRLTEKKEVEGVGMKYFSLVMTSDPALAAAGAQAGPKASEVPDIKSQAPSN